MNVMVKEVYEAFKDAGADEDKAMAAAQTVPAIETLATKADLAEVKGEIANVRGDVAQLRSEVAEIRVEVAEFRGEVRAEMADFRGAIMAEVASLTGKVGRIYWHLWLMGAGLLAAMMGLRLFG